MRKKLLLVINGKYSTLLLILIVSIFPLVLASDIDTQVTLGPKAPPHFRIHISVRSDDQQTKTIMESWIKREFRKLQDVSVVSFDKAVCIFDVTAMEPILISTGRKSGYIAVGSGFYIRSKNNPRLYYLPRFMVFMDNMKDLEDLCKELVADIDTNQLERVRESSQ